VTEDLDGANPGKAYGSDGFSAEASSGHTEQSDDGDFLVFALESDMPDDEASTLLAISTAVWSAVQSLFKNYSLQVPALKVLATDDLMASADTEGERLGIGPDRRSGVERIGGRVAGKTLISDDGSEAVVLVNRNELALENGVGQLNAAIIIAHELSHVLYGIARSATVGISPDCWRPWEVAEILAFLAAEEYRCDQLAILLVEGAFTPTDDASNPINVGALIGAPYLDNLPAVLNSIDPNLPDVIFAYRTRRISLEEMWREVISVSEQVLLIVAHAQAHSTDDHMVLDAIDHNCVSLLSRITGPLFDYLASSPVIPELDKWADDRSTLRRIGRDGLMAMWAQLGLHPRPDGEGVYTEVTDGA
jgi:hypothetical protein